MPKVLTEIYKPPQTSTLVDFLPHIQLISAGVVLLALVLCLHSRIRRIRPHPIKNINTCRPRTDCFSEALFPGANRRMNTDCPAMVFSPLECEGISCCTDNSPHFLRARPDLWRDMAERLKPHHTIRPPCTDTCTKPLTTCEGDRVQRGCGACVTDVPCAPTQAPCSICGNPTQMDRTTSQPSICNRCRRMPQKQQDTFSTDSSLQRPYGPRNQQSCFVPQNCSLPQNQTESQAQYGMQNVQQNVCKSCGKRWVAEMGSSETGRDLCNTCRKAGRQSRRSSSNPPRSGSRTARRCSSRRRGPTGDFPRQSESEYDD